MPTVLRNGPYRFYFYASDRSEPVHIHVEREERTAKFWLWPVRLQYNDGFSRVELRKIREVIEENKAIMIEAWNEYFGDRD